MEIGTTVSYRNQGTYKVLSKASEKTRTMFLIKDIDKGKGWCAQSNSYKGVSQENGWFIGRNFDYGIEIEVHKKDLQTLINS